LPASRSLVVLPFALAFMLQACSTTPASGTATAGTGSVATSEPSATEPAVPELELNLPQQTPCKCVKPPLAEDYTFFDKGYRSLLDGEYEDAMEHFQRYQRLESSPRADLEAGIAVAYLRMLPRSPFYNPQVARASFRVLREQNAKELKVNDSTRLMRQAVLNLLELQGKVDKLRGSNVALKEEVKKLEEALKRLRELTLSQ